MTEMIEPLPAAIDQEQLACELMERARAEGVELAGPGGLLTGLTKTVLTTALEAEMTGHLGYGKYEPAAGLTPRKIASRRRSPVPTLGPVRRSRGRAGGGLVHG
jgi:hypothetical protein